MSAKLKTHTVAVDVWGGEQDYCKDRFAFKEEDGWLAAGLAPVPSDVAVTLANAAFAKYLPNFGFSVLITTVGQFYKWNTADLAALKTAGVLNSIAPSVVEYVADGENAYVIICGARAAVIKKSAHSIVTLPYKMACCVVHCGRIFGCLNDDRFTLRWSGYGVSQWTEGEDGGGYIRLSPELGEICDIKKLGEKLVILRCGGITVFSGFGDSRHFRIDGAYQRQLPPIFANTCAICGGQLWFFTAEGLFSYDGSNLFCHDFSRVDKGFKCQNVAAKDERYLYFTGTFGGTSCLMEYDTVTGKTYRFATDCALPFFTDEADRCFKQRAMQVLQSGAEDEERFWQSKDFDLGTSLAKTLKYVTVEGEGEVTVTANCDGRKRQICGFGKKLVCERARTFSFTVTGTGKLKSLSAEWEVNG